MAMPEPDATATPEDHDAPIEQVDELQFDQAEYTTPAPSGPICSACQRPIADSYFEVNGKVVCQTCRQRVEAALTGGSRLVRGMRALAFGLAAALVGSALYYAFVRMTDTNWALVAIVLGFMVGGAVRAGTGNRGGRFYQLLAVFLTYSAIVAMHVPLVVEAMFQQARDAQQQAKPAPAEAKAASEKTKPPAPANAEAKPDPAKVAAAQENAANENAKEDAGTEEPKMNAAGLVMLLLLSVGFLYSVPVLSSFQAPISGLIYCFALWEAWKINKKATIAINGPFRVTTTGALGSAPEEIGDGG
jgi:hypothetical protein